MVAQLDDLTGVDTAEWAIVATDETSLAAAYTLAISGPKNSIATMTALGLGTAAILQCRINGGINKATQRPDPGGTVARAKLFVPAANGNEVICAGELLESNPTFGYAGIVNALLRTQNILSSGFTTLSASFTQPAVGSVVTADVAFSGWAVVGQVVFVEAAGYYLVTAVPNVSQITLKNLGYGANVAPGLPAGTPGGGVAPAGVIGAPAPMEVVLYSTFVVQNNGASDGPVGLQIINPSVDFPSATHVQFEGTFWTDRANAPPNWVHNHAYSVGDWVQNPGPSGAFVAYVCTTGGTSSATGSGPGTLGTGITDGPGGTTVWRAASVTLFLATLTGMTPTILVSFATSYTLPEAFLAGVTHLEFSFDVTAGILAIASPTAVVVGFSGDVADTGSTRYTNMQSSLAKLVFT